MSPPEPDVRRLLARFDETVAGCEQSDDLVTLEAAVAAWGPLVAHPDWPTLPADLRQIALDDAGEILHRRYQHTGRDADLDQAIELYRFAINQADADNRPVFRAQLATRLLDRHAATGDPADLAQAIGLHEAVLRDTPAHHPRLAMRLNNLGGAHRAGYAAGGDQVDLSRAIDLLRRAVAAGGPSHASAQNNLGVALSDRYELTGEPADLQGAVDAAERAVAATEPGTAERTMYLSNLASHLSDRYDRQGDLGDLDEAIAVLDEALGDPQAVPDLYNNMAMLLVERYQHSADPDMLDLAITCAETAAGAVPPRSPRRAGYLVNLGNALRLRFERTYLDRYQAGLAPGTGEGISVGDLLFAVTAYRTALDIADADPVLRPKILTNLGTALTNVSLLVSRPAELDEAIDVLTTAAAGSTDDSAHRAGRLNSLAAALLARYRALGAADDAESATAAFRAACAQGLRIGVRDALVAATNWGSWATQRRAWADAVEAYDSALRAVELLYRTQPIRKYKESWLRTARNLPAHAAFARARTGDHGGAVADLDRGRAMLLVEALERGRADLSRLTLDRPDLAARYRTAAGRLDQLEAATG